MTCLQNHHFKETVLVGNNRLAAVSLAVIQWLQHEGSHCDVVHAHEWGGLFQHASLYTRLRLSRPGLRLIIEPHGGHVWAMQGRAAYLRAVCWIGNPLRL